jgi:secondary thiamine-phosphate synthase enzyme
VKQAHGELSVATRGKGFYNLTRDVTRWLADQGVRDGLLTVFIQHTSASLVIQENADPDVRTDVAEFYERLVPEDTPWFRHTLEGPDDMPSHIRATLTQTQLSIPVRRSTLALGTWQAIYLFEHRAFSEQIGALRRSVLLHVIGE